MKTILATLNAKYIHMNLAVRYLKAYSEPDFPVEIREYTIKDPTMNIVTDLYTRKPELVGFSCYIWNIEETVKVIQLLKKVLPDVKVVLGGPEVSYDSFYWLERLPEVDCIAMGEGEETFRELIDVYTRGETLDKVLGIAYRKDEKCKINPARGKTDLREMPSPFRFEEDVKDLRTRVVYIETSRGCPFNCQFCLSSIELGVRYFNREKIKEDIRYLMANGARTIKFVDRTFNISRSYAMEMFQFIIDEHLPGTVFQFEITGDIMRPEVIDFLNENAPKDLIRFEIGVQSTNDYTNQLVKRRQNFEKLTRTVRMVKEGGKIVQHLDLIAGLPEENYSSFRKTFNDVFALRPEELQLGFLKMLRGTGLRLNAKQWDYEFMDHAPYEVVQNNVMDFDEIIRIKQVEDILDKYWNAHRMDNTIEFIVAHCFETPFDFFQSFGTYWEENCWSKIGHQLEDLYTRLYQFLKDTKIKYLDVVLSLMKFDYLRNQKFKPRKVWWEKTTDKKELGTIFQKLSVQHGLPVSIQSLSEREWFKSIVIEKCAFDLETYLLTSELIEIPSNLLFYYDGKENCVYYQIDSNFQRLELKNDDDVLTS